MKFVKTLTAGLLAAASFGAFAADYSDGDIHKNDYQWSQFNLMYAYEEHPIAPSAHTGHDYLEMEFGGRSGIFDLYGYFDVFDLTEHDGSDKEGKDKIFIKFAPRVSLDALTGKDLSFGPVQELYIATLFEWDGGSGSDSGYTDANGFPSFATNTVKVGIGSDVMVPWLGKIGLNVMGFYEMNAKDWNGVHVAANWFKPFHFFENKSFLAFQGYVDWQIGDSAFEGATPNQAEQSVISYWGIHWHSDHFGAGYGLKGFKDAYLLNDGVFGQDTTGLTHFFSVTYKF